MSSTLGLALTTFIAFLAIYSLGSLSGLISEKSGVVNIALDGKMIMGALTFAVLFQNEGFRETFNGFAPFVALFLAGITGLLFSFALSIFTIYFMGEQVIVGTALNLFAVAFSLVIIQGLFNNSSLTWVDTSGGWAGTINTVAIVMLIVTIFILLFAWFIINRTSYGLRLRASGENPYALETAGVSVYNTRLIALSIAGFLSGMAGGLFPIALGTSSFEGTVQGSGYISIAILIIGRWSVIGITIASFFFAGLMSVSSIWLSFNIQFPVELFNIIPFILPLIFLVVIKTTAAPTFAGKPYRKDIRN